MVSMCEWGHVLAQFYLMLRKNWFKEWVEEFIKAMEDWPEWKRRTFKYNLELIKNWQ